MNIDPQIVIFRDDDVGGADSFEQASKRFRKFIDTHELYLKYGVIHEIGYITGAQNTQIETTKYILQQPNIVINFHAHTEHQWCSLLPEEELRKEFDYGVKIIEDVFGKPPTKWFPPHHITNELSIKIANEYGLKVDTQKTWSLTHFIKNAETYYKNKPSTICHHFWSKLQQKYLENALKTYVQLLQKNGIK